MRFAENTQHDTSKVLRLPRKMTSEVFKVLRLPRKMQRIAWKRRKSIAPATQNDFWHVLKHVAMSRSATPATRNEAMRRWKPPRVTPFCRTYHRHGHTALMRAVANGCGQLGNVWLTQLNPQDPQSETGTLATHSGKNAEHLLRSHRGCFNGRAWAHSFCRGVGPRKAVGKGNLQELFQGNIRKTMENAHGVAKKNGFL